MIEEYIDTFQARCRPSYVNGQIIVVAEDQVICLSALEKHIDCIGVIIVRKPVHGSHIGLLSGLVHICSSE